MSILDCGAFPFLTALKYSGEKKDLKQTPEIKEGKPPSVHFEKIRSRTFSRTLIGNPSAFIGLVEETVPE